MALGKSTVSISIVGAGNMAWHLGHAFHRQGLKMVNIINRSSFLAKSLANEVGAGYTNTFSLKSEKADIVIVAVNDSSLPEVVSKLGSTHSMVVHTAGSMSIDVFKGIVERYGVFYPFQTVTRGVPVDLLNVPVCLEAQYPQDLEILKQLASTISTNVLEMNSGQRCKLHLAGAIANNFTNHLLSLTSDFMVKNDIDKKLILPLVEETIRKATILSSREAQTGPARRKNTEIIEKHLQLLSDEPELKNLYKVISDSIIAYYYK